MSNSMFGGIPDDSIIRGSSPEALLASFKEMIDRVAMLQKTIEFKLNGNLDSTDAREFGGWLIGITAMMSKSGTVGMSTKETAGDDIRFWAGGTDPETAPYRVRKSGRAYLRGSTVESSNAYPKIIMDPDGPDGKLFGAYTNANTYAGISPDVLGNGPGFITVNGGLSTGANYSISDTYVVEAFQGLKIKSGFDITFDVGGTSITFPSWGTIYSDSQGKTLKQELDLKATVSDLTSAVASLTSALSAKATKSTSTSSAGASFYNGGIAPGTVLATADGGSVTWGGISISSHSHTQN